MLEVADVCLSCGEVHPEQQFALRHGQRRECPKVILGRFPLLSRADGDGTLEEPVSGPAARRIRDYEIPTIPAPLTFTPFARRGDEPESRLRTLGMPWLPPPDLGEVV